MFPPISGYFFDVDDAVEKVVGKLELTQNSIFLNDVDVNVTEGLIVKVLSEIGY